VCAGLRSRGGETCGNGQERRDSVRDVRLVYFFAGRFKFDLVMSGKNFPRVANKLKAISA
jgi:hypothetical protein